MRCPDCDLRNSVAASKCASCGAKFKTKPVPVGIKLAGVAVVAGLVLWGIGAGTLPKLTDPEQSLARVARQVAQGPKNADDAKRIRADFDQALRTYLTKVGDSSNSEIAKKLQKNLPATSFEVHVSDLPRGLKVVEVDTVLQASNYLVMKSASGTKVFPLPGLNVFDDARLINENAGPMLVMLGHTEGQPPHRPQVKVYALLPDDIVDKTQNFLPPMRGDGAAKFAANGRDVILDFSLLSLGQAEKLFSPGAQVEDGTVRQYLEWKDARFKSRYEYGLSPFVALYSVARCLRYPDLTDAHAQYLGSSGEKLIQKRNSKIAGLFRVKRVASGGDKITYDMKGNIGEFQIIVQKAAGIWSIVSAKPAKLNDNIIEQAEVPPAKSAIQKEEHPKVASSVRTPAPIVEKKLTVRSPALQPDTNQASVKPDSKQPPKKADDKLSAKDTKPKKVEMAHKPSQDNPPAPKAIDSAAAMHKNNHSPIAKAVEPVVAAHKPSQNSTVKPTQKIVGASAQITRQIATPKVALRYAPESGAKAVTSLPKGAAIEILSKHHGWYKVRYHGKEGFVYGGLVDYKKPDAYTTAVITKTKVVTDGRHTLSKPRVGDRLVVLGGIQHNKYHVQLANGKTGYLDKDALDVSIEAPPLVP